MKIKQKQIGAGTCENQSDFVGSIEVGVPIRNKEAWLK